VVLQASALFAQGITGTWQGTIHTTRDFREIIQISKDGTVLKAVLFALGRQPGLNFGTRPGLSFTSTAVSFQRNVIRMEFAGIGGVYQGTLSADGNSIAGGLSQNGATLTLNLVRATAQTAWPVPEMPVPEKPLTADVDPAFEVATIKPTPPGTLGSGSGPSPGGRFTAHNMTLSALMADAYGLNRNRMENVPGWLDIDRFDMVAKTDMDRTKRRSR